MSWQPNLADAGKQTPEEKVYWAARRKHNLLAEARQAASWGAPNAESVGYSHSDLCSIISKLVAYIEQN